MTITTQRSRAYTPTSDIGKRLSEAFALQAEIQQLQAQLDVHRDFFLTHMENKKLDKIELGSFIISRRTRHNWSYSPATQNDMLQLQTTQAWEQSRGIATDRPCHYIVMTVRDTQK